MKAGTCGHRLAAPVKGDDAWLLAGINTSLATPMGYRAPAVPAKVRIVSGPAAPASDKPAESPPDHVLLGRSELSELRRALVVLDDHSWPTPLEAAAAVGRLACAGAVVLTHELPPSVRDLLPAALLQLGDTVASTTGVSSEHLEDLSVNVRRVAHRHFGHRPAADQGTPTVAVVIDPASGSADRLESEFARQQNVTVIIARSRDWEEILTQREGAGEEAVGYVADTRSDVTYGPHHLEDLIHAMRHSGADCAFSPSRFEHHSDQGVLLEDAAVPIETMLPLGTTAGSGTSLWYRSASPAGPLRYAVHGCQSVVLAADPPPRGTRAQGKVHRRVPPQISWAADLFASGGPPAPTYIARAAGAARN